jgi:starch synthase
LRILFATSEAHPLIKTGGLADVSGALPKALTHNTALDVDIKILLPGYSAVINNIKETTPIAEIKVLGQVCSLVTGKLPGSNVDVIIILNSYLYERKGGPYSDEDGIEWPDNALRFAVLSRIGSILCSDKSPMPDWRPDLIHCNDWQTGLTPAYMKLLDKSTTKSIISIHNLAFQGNFEATWLRRLELPLEHFQLNGFEYFKQISFLKAGLYYADQLSTVSPTYAKEIQTTKFGFGLEGLLQLRANDLTGILNGIDTQEWNPAVDDFLTEKYSVKNMDGKKAVKQALQEELGLQIDANAPLLGVVSRLTHQKGLDLLPEIMPKLIEKGYQFAILGSGDKKLEDIFLSYAKRFKDQVSVSTGYYEKLSHRIMAGSDIFIMPSRFEPCGLNQLYGLAYGTPPIVTPTGGLADSVTDTNAQSLKDKSATGFVLEATNSAALMAAISRAIDYWHKPKVWQQILCNGMQQDISWESSAKSYAALYQKTLLLG